MFIRAERCARSTFLADNCSCSCFLHRMHQRIRKIFIVRHLQHKYSVLAWYTFANQINFPIFFNFICSSLAVTLATLFQFQRFSSGRFAARRCAGWCMLLSKSASPRPLRFCSFLISHSAHSNFDTFADANKYWRQIIRCGDMNKYYYVYCCAEMHKALAD